jgi:protein-tyrosine kinase
MGGMVHLQPLTIFGSMSCDSAAQSRFGSLTPKASFSATNNLSPPVRSNSTLCVHVCTGCAKNDPSAPCLSTSTVPNEGKTFVTLNLGEAIARQHERRALLIDADLRASRLHVPLGAPPSPGLADFLRGEADVYSIIQADKQNDLFFIPAGRPVSNPAELLSNMKLRELLNRVGPAFDWVILDAPPVLPVSDAGVLAGLCDGVLFVVRAGATTFDQAQMACQEFRGKNLVGVVLNRVEEREAYGAYPYYAGNGRDKR